MRIKVPIVRQDIEHGEFNTANCPESIALRRALDEANIDYVYAFVRQQGKSLSANIVKAFSIDGTDHVDLKTYTVHLLRYPCNKHLANWSANFNKCIKSCWWGGVYHTNTDYDEQCQREDIEETSFEFNLPKDFRIGKHLSHKIQSCFYEYFTFETMGTGLPKRLYNISGRMHIQNLYDKYLSNENVFIEELMQGELAKREYEHYKTFGIWNNQTKKFVNSSATASQFKGICVPTYEYSVEGENIETVINSLLERFKYDDLLVHVMIRNCYFDVLEAGIAIAHGMKKEIEHALH